MPIDHIDPQWLADIEGAVEYVSLIDANDKILYVNHTETLPDTISGLSVYEFVEPAYHNLLRQAVSAVREIGTPQHYNSYAQNKEGTRSQYSNWVVAMNSTALQGIVAFIATDVTELSRVEEELQMSDSTLHSLITSSPDTIFIVDRNLTLLYASRFEYGFDSSLVIGLSADLFIPKEELPRALAVFDKTLNSGTVGHYEATVETPKGPRRFSARLAPIENQDQIERIMVVVTDVTEKHAAETEQHRLQEQLLQSQKMEAIGQLTGGISHDFNNLLLTIGGNLELAQSCLDDPAQTERYIRDALDGVQRGRDLNQRLLAFSRKQPLSPEALDVGVLAQGMVSLLRRTLGENIRVRMDVLSSRGHVSRIDRTQLENAVLNLALNARDAMPDGGELAIRTEWLPPQDSASEDTLGVTRMTIQDNGTGMSESTLAQSTEPFFTTKPVGKGSGLGLSMVYGFVKQSGGELRIRSKLGQGTTVEIDLPCVEGSHESGAKTEDDLAILQGNGELILLVEDDKSVRKLTVKLLESLGYETLTAEDGAAALVILKAREDIQLLITDVMMPGAMNGYDLANVCSELRPELPVMLVSGHPLDQSTSKQHDRWISSLLQKPYRTGELAKFVADKLVNAESNRP